MAGLALDGGDVAAFAVAGGGAAIFAGIAGGGWDFAIRFDVATGSDGVGGCIIGVARGIDGVDAERVVSARPDAALGFAGGCAAVVKFFAGAAADGSTLPSAEALARGGACDSLE